MKRKYCALMVALAISSFAQAQEARMPVQLNMPVAVQPVQGNGQQAGQQGTPQAVQVRDNTQIIDRPMYQPTQQTTGAVQPTTPVQIPDLPVGEVLTEDQNRAVFDMAKRKVMPLSPEEINEFRGMVENVKRVKGMRSGTLPESVTTSHTVSFAPGEPQKVIRLGKDLVTTLTFTDATGEPWPVLNAFPGSKAIEIKKLGESIRTNMIPITLNTEYVSTNLTVYLEGASSPVVFMIVDAQKTVDTVAKIMVRARGPLAKALPQVESVTGKTVQADLVTAMDGITPTGFSELKVVGMEETRAWSKAGLTILRTKGTLLSPAPARVLPASDGTVVYEIPDAASIVLSIAGITRAVSLSGFPVPVAIKN